MSHHITQEARKYLQRSRIPKFVLDQITELANRAEELERENQYLRMKDQSGGFRREQGGDQSQPMGFIYPFRYRPWFPPYFRTGEDYTREDETQNRRGYDTPYQGRPYPDEMRYNPQYPYNPNREVQPQENPTLNPVR